MTGDNKDILVLFDMDWTLVDIGPIHEIGTRAAFAQVWGCPDPVPETKEMSGLSNYQCFEIRCRQMGIPDDLIRQGLERALQIKGERTAQELADADRFVLPGAAELVHALNQRGYRMALITGSEAPTAQAVLANSVLGRALAVGATGDEAPVRADMLRLAIRRMSAKYGWANGPRTVVLVGDTPEDVEAGRAVGTRVVSVATGSYSADELAALQPDAVLPSLADWQAALVTVEGILRDQDGA